MQMDIVISDVVLVVIVALGMAQMAWFSVMLVRRGASPAVIQQSIPAFLTVWVLMWPVYMDQYWLALGLAAFFVPILLSSVLSTPFWQHLRMAWGSPETAVEQAPRLPQLPFFIALCVAGTWFQFASASAFGLGMALSLCVAFPAAHWVDVLINREKVLSDFIFPKQSLAGHLLFVAVCSMVICWSLHVYDGQHWQSEVDVVLLASISAALCRAYAPVQWKMPVTIAMLGLILTGFA